MSQATNSLAALCRARVAVGDVRVAKGKQDTPTSAIERRLSRLLSLYTVRGRIGAGTARRGEGQSERECPVGDGDVLCQASAWIADVGWLSSAARSALRAARWVTAAPPIRWVAVRSGRGPDGLGM